MLSQGFVEPVTWRQIAGCQEEEWVPGIVMNFISELNKLIMLGVLNRKAVEARNGKWKEFNKHAVLISEGVYVNNKKHGVWREYYDSNGSLMIEETYWHGVQHGRFASFHPSGKLLSEGEFQNGSREGCFKVYDESGTNIRNIVFFNNEEVEGVDGYKLNVDATAASGV